MSWPNAGSRKSEAKTIQHLRARFCRRRRTQLSVKLGRRTSISFKKTLENVRPSAPSSLARFFTSPSLCKRIHASDSAGEPPRAKLDRTVKPSTSRRRSTSARSFSNMENLRKVLATPVLSKIYFYDQETPGLYLRAPPTTSTLFDLPQRNFTKRPIHSRRGAARRQTPTIRGLGA